MLEVKMNSVIILTRMYVGEYLEENIGHEVINMFKDDNGDNYIYVNHDGLINQNYNDKVKAVLLVKHVEKGVLEVIAKAEELVQVLYKTGNVQEEAQSQIDYINKNNIRYGGALLHEVHNNSPEEKRTITFKTGKLRKAKEPLYLVEDGSLIGLYENCCYLPEKHFSNQSLKMYYDDERFPKDYAVLESCLNNEELWEKDNTTQKVDINDVDSLTYKNNFLSMIRKQDDELVFSNLLAHFFEENRKVFVRFCKETLGIDDFTTDFQIFRETKNHIDLWIEDTNHIIVIENKIKSKINGERHDIYSNSVQSQLEEYYEYAIDHSNGKNVQCFVLSPDYNRINLDKYESGKQYKIVHYSNVFDFYKRNAGEMINLNYFVDFLNGLQMHSTTVDNNNFETMKNRFIERINRRKDNNK